MATNAQRPPRVPAATAPEARPATARATPSAPSPTPVANSRPRTRKGLLQLFQQLQHKHNQLRGPGLTLLLLLRTPDHLHLLQQRTPNLQVPREELSLHQGNQIQLLSRRGQRGSGSQVGG